MTQEEIINRIKADLNKSTKEDLIEELTYFIMGQYVEGSIDNYFFKKKELSDGNFLSIMVEDLES